jgi:hypothetical protein
MVLARTICLLPGIATKLARLKHAKERGRRKQSYFLGPVRFVMKEPVSNQRNYSGASPKEIYMSERHWEAEQRSVVGRFFDLILGRNEVPEDKIDKEMRWLHSLNKHLDDGDEERLPMRLKVIKGSPDVID